MQAAQAEAAAPGGDLILPEPSRAAWASSERGRLSGRTGAHSSAEAGRPSRGAAAYPARDSGTRAVLLGNAPSPETGIAPHPHPKARPRQNSGLRPGVKPEAALGLG